MPRLAGFKGAVYLDTGQASATNRIADIYNITLEVEQELAECGVKLEAFEKYQQGRLMGRLTGERYITDTTTVTGGIGSPGSGADLVGGSVMGAELIFLSPTSGNHFIGNQVSGAFRPSARSLPAQEKASMSPERAGWNE